MTENYLNTNAEVLLPWKKKTNLLTWGGGGHAKYLNLFDKLSHFSCFLYRMNKYGCYVHCKSPIEITFDVEIQ